MKKMFIAFCFLTISKVVYADGTVYIGYASSHNDGLEIGGGYHGEKDNFLLNVNFLSWVIHEGDQDEDGRYREETFSNGQTVCRDTTNGQFADKENCEGDSKYDYEYAPSIDLSYKLSYDTPFSVGVGYRGGDEPEPYGLITFHFNRTGFVSFRGASEYKGIWLGFTF